LRNSSLSDGSRTSNVASLDVVVPEGLPLNNHTPSVTREGLDDPDRSRFKLIFHSFRGPCIHVHPVPRLDRDRHAPR